MIRESLENAVQNGLESHPILARSDFVVRRYQSNDNDACLKVSYRHSRKLFFDFAVKNNGGSPGEYYFNLTMSPGIETSEQVSRVHGRFALIQELKAWQQRLHEDLGAFPISRQCESHSAGIGKLRERMALMPGDTSSQLEKQRDFLFDLDAWWRRMSYYVNSQQNHHHGAVIGTLKRHLDEMQTMTREIDAMPVDSVAAGKLAEVRVGLEQSCREAAALIERELFIRQMLDEEKLCLLEEPAFQEETSLLLAHSRSIETMTALIHAASDGGSVHKDRRDGFIEQWNARLERVRKDVDSLNYFRRNDVTAQFKRHLTIVENMRERIERTPGHPLALHESARFYGDLDQIMKEATELLGKKETEKGELIRETRKWIGASRVEEEKNFEKTIAYLNGKLQTMERLIRNYRADMSDPHFPEKNEAWKERAELRLSEEKRTVSSTIDILKRDMESTVKLWEILGSGIRVT